MKHLDLKGIISITYGILLTIIYHQMGFLFGMFSNVSGLLAPFIWACAGVFLVNRLYEFSGKRFSAG